MANWYQKMIRAGAPDRSSDADIPGLTAAVYAGLDEAGVEFKPASRLPAELHVVREEFKRAFRREYHQLTSEVRHSYHHVYRELAFFLEAPLADRCERIVDELAKAFQEQDVKQGRPPDDLKLARSYVMPIMRLPSGREEFLKQLVRLDKDRDKDRRLLVEVCTYCNAMYGLLWNEWVAYENFVRAIYRDSSHTDDP
jgi:hypothetical protein